MTLTNVVTNINMSYDGNTYYRLWACSNETIHWIKLNKKSNKKLDLYISADNEIEEDVGSSEYNLAAKHSSASNSQIQ
jgi:hypothetical protein